MSKRKAASLDLTEKQVIALNEASGKLPSNLECLEPVLESLRSAHIREPPHKKISTTCQATDFRHAVTAAKAVGINYIEVDKFRHGISLGPLSEHVAWVIKELKSSDYLSVRLDESVCRTVLNLIIVDRLRKLEDKDVYHRLQVSTEVPVSIRAQNIYGDEEIVKGTADWVLGYGIDKNNTGSILVVLEAKPYQLAAIGTPQILMCMAAVHRDREARGKTNQKVFGILSDSKEFRFCFLNDEKIFFVSKPVFWSFEQATIIAYIDSMLKSAIGSSPNTKPSKTKNRNASLWKRWSFGDYENIKEEKWEEEGETTEGKATEGKATEGKATEDEKDEDEEANEENDRSLADVVTSSGRLIKK